MRDRSFFIAILILLAVGLACDGVSRIGGRVLDAEGDAVEGASVLFETVKMGEGTSAYQCDVRTSRDGSFGCGITHAPFWNIDLRLTISKEGYNTYVRELTAKELQQSPGGNMGSQVIILERH